MLAAPQRWASSCCCVSFTLGLRLAAEDITLGSESGGWVLGLWALALLAILSALSPLFPGLRFFVSDVLLRRVAHYPRQRHFFLLREIFEVLVNLNGKTDRRPDRALGLHLLHIPFVLSILAVLKFHH